MQLDVYQRMGLDRASEKFADAQRLWIEHGAEAKLARGASLELSPRELQLLDSIENPLGVREQGAPAGSERHSARRAFEQGQTQRLFERLELPA